MRQLCFPFTPLLKAANSWDWREEHDEAFSELIASIKKVGEVTNFKRNADLRLFYDAN